MMKSSSLLVLLLLFLLSLVEVHCQQTFPYVSFGLTGQSLADHSYVDLSTVGSASDDSDSVVCHTDLSTCCSVGQGVHRGDWYFPDGTVLPFSSNSVPIGEGRGAQRAVIRRTSATGPTGIYHCGIPTNAVHHDTDMSVRDTVYVGLYPADGGDVIISGGVVFDSDQLTLTCISTGGPATTVTWTRDSITVTEGTETVLDDPETAQYTHTLTVTTGGEYTCTVSNNKPSSNSASITVGGASPPSDVTAAQDGPTSIRVSWTPPSPLGDTTGYRISYTGGGSVDVDGGNTNSHTLTGLINGQTYTISIVGTSSSDVLPSPPIVAGSVNLVTVVGLDKTAYSISESDEVVHVCINAAGSNTLCSNTDHFQLTLNTADQSAVSPTDYEAVSKTVIFATCDSQQCVNINITNDLINEPEETFTISLTLSGDAPSFIILTSATGEVLIYDDDDKPEAVFSVEDSTVVRLSWSGSVNLSTFVCYTVHCSLSGVIMSVNERVLPPGVNSTVVVLDDDITLTDVYVHNFTLYYIIRNDVTSPQTTAVFTFDKSNFQIQFGPFHFCLDWDLKKTAGVRNQLQSYLIQVIRKQCSDCYDLTPSFLRPGMFICHGNPTKTTYRSTLINPFPTTTAARLVGIIQSWVSSNPAFILDDLLVRVSGDCPTNVSSLDEGECESGTRTDPELGERITQTLNLCAIRDLGREVCRL